MAGKIVLLFRAPKEHGEDLFEVALQAEGYITHNVPVLEFQFMNLDRLAACLQCWESYQAVVFTSQRAVEATVKAQSLAKCLNTGEAMNTNLQCFVVGESTSKAACEAGFKPQGAGSGNAENLADYITKSLLKPGKPLLYPCGNLRRDTLSCKLKVAEEIEVYKTVKSSHIKEEIEAVLHKVGSPDYAVFFSPSGVQCTVDLLKDDTLSLKHAKVIAIGPTTERELVSQGIEVMATAPLPSPEGLLAAIDQHS
ncbi:uroporphyrinogen-III synthase-like isoform X2 [Dreissena polymorpha]|uniref:uroporphyrinogen-III synthase-like isoform X2 n=1 Tax=Dreissena polymorpha TaxID=45954 RepID=UPI002264C362|nr:uroporphyrinogen-III synthase-like isoform X2 [Dreissena polymorpha]